MKHLKISAIVVSAALAASFAAAQQAAPAPTPAAAPAPAAAPVSPKDKPDRSYSADYAGQKAALSLVDKTNGGENPVTLKSAEGKELVFSDSAGGELSVAKNTKAYRFRVRADNKLLNAAREAANDSDWDAAADYMRPVVYPIAPLAVLSDDVFPDGNAMIEFFLSSLSSAGRLKEAAAYVGLLPIQDASDSIRGAALGIARSLAARNQTAEAEKIVNRVRLNSASAETLSQIMEVLNEMRNSGDYKRCVLLYSKLSALEGNPAKNQAALWGVFCDMAMGNELSARGTLSAIEMDRSVPEFSLLQMVNGMLKEKGDKPDVKGALELYSEGVVFGSLTDPWMPELLYKTAMAYKKIKNFVASNEIFAQLETLYPDNPFTALGKKEVVVIKKEEPEASDGGGEEDEDEE